MKRCYGEALDFLKYYGLMQTLYFIRVIFCLSFLVIKSNFLQSAYAFTYPDPNSSKSKRDLIVDLQTQDKNFKTSLDNLKATIEKMDKEFNQRLKKTTEEMRMEIQKISKEVQEIKSGDQGVMMKKLEGISEGDLKKMKEEIDYFTEQNIPLIRGKVEALEATFKSLQSMNKIKSNLPAGSNAGVIIEEDEASPSKKE